MPDTLHGNTPASSLRPEPAMVEHLRERLNELDENIDLEDFEDCRRFHVEFGALTGDDYNRLDMFMSSIPKDFPYDLTMPSQQTNDQTELRYFQSSLWRDQKLDASRVGVNKLKTFLQALLDRHIEKELPKTAHTGFASAAYIGHVQTLLPRHETSSPENLSRVIKPGSVLFAGAGLDLDDVEGFESGRWLRAFTKTRDVESQQSPRLGSDTSVKGVQPAQYQTLDAGPEEPATRLDVPQIIEPRVSEDALEELCDLGTLSGGLLIPGLPSPTISPTLFGLQQQSGPEVSLLAPPRPVLIAKNSDAYFTPSDIYAADIHADLHPDIHVHDIYANDHAANSSSSLASSTPSGYCPLTASPTSNRKRTRKLSLEARLKAGWQSITQRFDPQCFWKMIDMREIFLPFTWKRYITLTVIGLLIGAIIVTDHFFHWINASMAITRRNMLPVLVLVLGLEPIMIVVILIFAKIPDQDTPDESTTDTEKISDIEAQGGMQSDRLSSESDNRTALVIPCHNSDHEAMLRVLASAYPHFRPCNIFVIDNARSMHPKDNIFREFIHSQHADDQRDHDHDPGVARLAIHVVAAMCWMSIRRNTPCWLIAHCICPSVVISNVAKLRLPV
ncbi:hypothetical protein LTR12_017304 [Friedmanniomyces endolithicus]|nr:hypothetical protein LTR12_017304 [Friedmanniomyces endolithicus]